MLRSMRTIASDLKSIRCLLKWFKYFHKSSSHTSNTYQSSLVHFSSQTYPLMSYNMKWDGNVPNVRRKWRLQKLSIIKVRMMEEESTGSTGCHVSHYVCHTKWRQNRRKRLIWNYYKKDNFTPGSCRIETIQCSSVRDFARFRKKITWRFHMSFHVANFNGNRFQFKRCLVACDEFTGLSSHIRVRIFCCVISATICQT